jgi:methionyl-tRNA synthetase
VEEKVTVLPAKENISFDQFASLDIRVGTILKAEKVAKTKKLLKLNIDAGIDQRTVVSATLEESILREKYFKSSAGKRYLKIKLEVS